MVFRMEHFNLNVSNLDKSLAFYREALGLHEVRRHRGDAFTLVFMADETGSFLLELTCLDDHPQPYELGENEIHMGFRTDDYAAAHEKHKQMGVICYENPGMGIYFIEDPDGYWMEVCPQV
nr:VOC family protein [bacterium]